ncbi:TetR/AcrR family transcriptional regulator [Kiloniella sp.]|uniref:TetR/AcrR family transcriptional regulator n=1 Tax=Kiloniella sp. TaxID=1938587 RepID=UPI003A8FD5E4
MTPSLTLVRRRLPAQQRSKQRVQRILLAASTLLTTSSVDKLTTRRISELADVNIATLYQFFPNKEAIIFALYQRWLSEMDDVFDRMEMKQSRQMGWRKLFSKIFDALNQVQTDLIVRDRLLKAMGMNEDLRKLDLDHSILLSKRLAKLMANQGAYLSEYELQEHGTLIFHFERALVTPLANAKGNDQEVLYKKGRDFLLEMISLAFR